MEGIHDKYRLEIFLRNELEDFIIIPGANAESIYNNIPRLIAYNKKYIAIWDNDEEGNEYYNKSIKSFGKLECDKMMRLPNLYNKKKVRMEEMFKKGDLEELAQFLEMPSNASYSNIMTAIIGSDEQTIEECIKLISEESRRNFRELFSMINNVYNKKSSDSNK